MHLKYCSIFLLDLDPTFLTLISQAFFWFSVKIVRCTFAQQFPHIELTANVCVCVRCRNVTVELIAIDFRRILIEQPAN